MTDAAHCSQDRQPAHPPKRASRFLVAMVLAAGLLAAFIASPDELTQRKTLSEFEVSLAVKSLDTRAGSPDGSTRPEPNRHRLTVTLTDDSTDTAVADATVTANVAEEGFAGSDFTLLPAAGEPGVYSAAVLMPGRKRYRILVRFAVPGEPRVREALFYYTHHH